MLMFARFAAQFAFGSALLALVGMATLLAFAPTPASPPLINVAGVALNEAEAAHTIESVFHAVRNDDTAAIEKYLAAGFSPNVRSPRGDTLLIVAAYRDRRAAVDVLLAAPEIDLEAGNRAGLTAVAAAAFKGHDETLRRLIAAGANANSSNATQQSALMFAKLAGNSSTVEILKQAGADDATRPANGASEVK